MQTYITLLKGINVGGHKKLPMAELRSLLDKLGFDQVQTYIQSGNAIFKSTEKNTQIIEEKISNLILEIFGFEVSVLVLTRNQLSRIFDYCPFKEDLKQSSYFFILHDTPNEDMIKMASEKIYVREDYKILDNCIYYYGEKGLGQAKFNINFFERKLNTFATARNYNTMLKLLSLSSD